MSDLTQDELKRILEYDQDTGIFTWKIKPRANVELGAIAGWSCNKGYINIKIYKKTYKAHRLVYFYINGIFPLKQIDHINGIKYDNRLCNLRDSTNRENCSNKTRHRNGKLIGASFHQRDQIWSSQIYFNKKAYYLGRFKTELEAHNKYLEKLKELEHGI
jgi:hypothetical protein